MPIVFTNGSVDTVSTNPNNAIGSNLYINSSASGIDSNQISFTFTGTSVSGMTSIEVGVKLKLSAFDNDKMRVYLSSSNGEIDLLADGVWNIATSTVKVAVPISFFPTLNTSDVSLIFKGTRVGGGDSSDTDIYGSWIFFTDQQTLTANSYATTQGSLLNPTNGYSNPDTYAQYDWTSTTEGIASYSFPSTNISATKAYIYAHVHGRRRTSDEIVTFRVSNGTNTILIDANTTVNLLKESIYVVDISSLGATNASVLKVEIVKHQPTATATTYARIFEAKLLYDEVTSLPVTVTPNTLNITVNTLSPYVLTGQVLILPDVLNISFNLLEHSGFAVIPPTEDLNPFKDGSGLHLMRFEQNGDDVGGIVPTIINTPIFRTGHIDSFAYDGTTYTEYRWQCSDFSDEFTITYHVHISSAVNTDKSHTIYFSGSENNVIIEQPSAYGRDHQLYIDGDSYFGNSGAYVVDDWNFISLSRQASTNTWTLKINHVVAESFVDVFQSDGYLAVYAPTKNTAVDQLRVFNKVLTNDELVKVDNEVYIEQVPIVVTPDVIEFTLTVNSVVFPNVTVFPPVFDFTLNILDVTVVIGETAIPYSGHIVDIIGDGSGLHLWHFDNADTLDSGSGVITTDNPSTYMNGIYGKGQNNLADIITDFSDMGSGTQFTYTCWVYIATDATPHSPMFSFGIEGTDSYIACKYVADGEVFVSVKQGGGTQLNTNIVKGKWLFCAVTLNGADTRFYFDHLNQNFWSGVNVVAPTRMILVGSPYVNHDAIRMFSRVLTEAEMNRVSIGDGRIITPVLITPEPINIYMVTKNVTISTELYTLHEMGSFIFTQDIGIVSSRRRFSFNQEIEQDKISRIIRRVRT